MPQRSKLAQRPALCVLTSLLSATGIGIGLTGCIVPGMSTFVMKPERIAPPPFEEIAQSAPSSDSGQNGRPTEDVGKGEPRRELVFPETSDLPPPSQAEE
jgi:hypothetical protein